MSYSRNFLDSNLVEVPSINAHEHAKFLKHNYNIKRFYLDYIKYSVFQNPFRKLPYYTATNIEGTLFQKISRDEIFENGRDNWQKDSRIPDETQLGKELYSAEKSDFDKGHLTKREDVQWGKTEDEARFGAASTFYFTNAAPQVDRLNRGVWRRIEDYVLHHEVVKLKMKICMFTGPIFLDTDSEFVTPINGEIIKIPNLFYKVIYYEKAEKLYRTGFLTSQKNLLEVREIVKPVVSGMRSPVTDPFLDFKDAETYQVKVAFIEKTSGLKFQNAFEVFEDETPEHLILSEVEIDTRGTRSVIYHSNLKL